MTKFNVLVGLIRTYPVIQGWDSLTIDQKQMVNDQGWYEDDFPVPKWEGFWEADGLIFSNEMDLIPIGSFTFDGWTHQFSIGSEKFVSRFVNDGATIEVAKIIVEEIS